MPSSFANALQDLDERAFQLLYGRWDPLDPRGVAKLLASSSVRWYIAGGRAARAGAPARHHEDTDAVARLDDLDELRDVLADWDLWEADSGWLRPLLPGVPLGPDTGQLWARRDADHPWQFEVLLDRASGDEEWVYKRDHSVRLPWHRALHAVDGIPYLRPEVALLLKAKGDRPKDRQDLAVAVLDPAGRAWLAATLDRLGHGEWARLARERGGRPDSSDPHGKRWPGPGG